MTHQTSEDIFFYNLFLSAQSYMPASNVCSQLQSPTTASKCLTLFFPFGDIIFSVASMILPSPGSSMPLWAPFPSLPWLLLLCLPLRCRHPLRYYFQLSLSQYSLLSLQLSLVLKTQTTLIIPKCIQTEPLESYYASSSRVLPFKCEIPWSATF